MDLIIKRDIVFHKQKLKQGQKYTPKNDAESRYLIGYKLAIVYKEESTEPKITVNTEHLQESTEPKKEVKPKKEK